ncbi:transporter substrate-binding domain-containing protein [Modestobacter sp. I12A-02628]|uniref:Amino acid ABC transporter substrate-binding protein n=1 Tax=Goekera deserti TaxID=2497753 RepID=A0A7K3WCS7_9ACTN|nr:ABC transporter substrate-binding protein [Goekera deserti]MPQ97564.1 transporter substrate-binding domain-containing protein [Goekera deserti]NDI47832.1 transporter substrate-binding domain-containing protein [Goekera deserti]NEL53580.1 amino acid ABC transporter substrate-binding protein [Goekera deserti]
MRSSPLALAVLTAALLAAGACATEDSASDGAGASGTPSGGGSCAPADLDTVEADTLTVATDQPAYGPWFVDDDPANGEGYESAVAYAVAEQLGYTEDQVTWTRVQFNAAITPGTKPFDFDVNQFTITDERRQAVDFSSPYYTATQAVITTAGSAADGATSIADLKGLRLGAQVATTSLDVLTDVIAPDSDPAVFNTNDDAKLALQNGQVDGIVVDLPTAFYITSAELDDGVIVGQIADSGESGDQFGLLLAKDSPLTDCVTRAVDALREDGTLDALQQQWLAEVADAPVLS